MELGVSAVRARLSEALGRVAAGEEITITRHGRPVAVIVRPDALRVRRASAAIAPPRSIAALLESARARPLGAPTLSVERADELVEALRRDRAVR